MRNFKHKAPLWLGGLVMLLLAAGASLCLGGCGSPAEPTPTPAPTLVPTPTPDPGIVGNAAAELSVGGADQEGVVTARYLAQSGKRVKLRVTREGGADYNYDLAGDGSWEQFPLSEGDGVYTLTVFEQVEDIQYAPVLTHTLTLALTDQNAPFLRPNQQVNYTPDSAAVATAAEVTAGLSGDGDKIGAVYSFVTGHLAYDDLRSETVEPGYVSDVDAVLAAGEGICLDYAALMSAMLRSQGVPCKMVVGYAGITYHAWVEVPDAAGGWTRMDPTFVSSRGDTPRMAEYIQNDANYRTVYVY